MRRRGSILPGLLLVLFGTFLLLDRLDFYYSEWSIFLPALSLFLGVILWMKALTTKEKGKVFPGTFLIVVGLFLIASELEFFDFYGDIWPIFPTAVGLSFLSLIVVNYRNWWAIFPAVPNLIVGFVGFAYYMDYMDRYEIEDLAYYTEDFFRNNELIVPAFFLLMGTLVVFSALRKSHKNKKDELNDDMISE